MLPTRPPKKLPLDLETVESKKGRWLIAVDVIVQTQSHDNILLRIILEHGIDEERFVARNLEMILSADSAYDPARVSSIIAHIREWIESTDGDGFLDLTRS